MGVSFGDHADTIVYMRGVCNELAKVTKYEEIWDLNLLLNYLKKVIKNIMTVSY